MFRCPSLLCAPAPLREISFRFLPDSHIASYDAARGGKLKLRDLSRPLVGGRADLFVEDAREIGDAAESALKGDFLLRELRRREEIGGTLNLQLEP